MVVLGWRLDFMILEVFSNLSESIILWFYDSDVSSIRALYTLEFAYPQNTPQLDQNSYPSL